MNNLYLAFSVVFPLLCMMVLGYFLKAVGIFNENFLLQLNNLCFKVFLPLILFVNIYKSDFRQAFRIELVIFALAGIIAAFGLLMQLIPLLVREQKNRGVVVQGIFRSNFILFGIPVAASLYGAENTSVTAILIAFVIPLFNALSVVALEVFSAKKSGMKQIVKGIVKNPLIIASILAFIAVLTRIRLPLILEKTLVDISEVATPLALIVLGGSFQFRNLVKSWKLLVFSVLGKLIFLPAVFVPIAVWFGFRGMELAALFAMFASPTAVSSFTMAQNAGANDELAGQIIVADSILSMITIFIWITLLKQMSLI